MPFLIALVLGLGLTPLCLAAGRAAGLVDRPSGDGLKIHADPVPLTGGLAVAIAALAAAATVGPLPWWLPASVGASLALGTVDDARSLPPWVRLAVQGGIGGLLVAGGLRLGPMGALGSVGVVAAVIACMNAVNLMDGQDGLVGGLGAIAAAGLAVLLPAGGAGRGLALATAGATAAFLLWNRPPARVFLGDGGAYTLGTLLAVLAIDVGRSGWPPLLAAVVCLGVFAAELVTTVARRMLTLRSLLLGDRDHAYDLAARLLGSRARSTAFFWGLGMVSALAALRIEAGPPSLSIAVATAYGAVALISGWWLRLRIHRPEREMA